MVQNPDYQKMPNTEFVSYPDMNIMYRASVPTYII